MTAYLSTFFFFTAVPYGPCTGEIGFSRKIPVLGILKKLPCWKRLFFSENFPIGKIVPLCVGPVLWCVGTLKFFKISLCVGPVLWYVGTLSFFNISLCVGPVLWCVWTLKFFKLPLCVGPVLWCGDFEFFQNFPVCGPCAVVWRL